MIRAPRPTWVDGAAGSGHDVDHLPYGVTADGVVVRIGDAALDLAATTRVLRPEWSTWAAARTLNPLMAAGPRVWHEVRAWVVDVLTDEAYADRVRLVDVAELDLLLAWEVADYVDYYASEQHATNVGRIFRPDGEALLPNWKHLPVAYHGRAGSVVVSGTDVHRPWGQRLDAGAAVPTYGPSRRLDIEAELGFVVGRTLPLGTQVATSELATTVFGVTGLNDWSARDIQAWEYVPLGPNLAKSFATSVSAWVTPLAALESARCDLPGQAAVPVLGYLEVGEPAGYDVSVEVEVDGTVVSRPPYSSTYWSPAQMLAHLTVNGASLRVGDLFGSGTISGPERDQWGSLLELSWGGREPFEAGGRQRSFLEDGDEVVLRYSAPGALGGRIEMGEVRGRVVPATGVRSR